ncbi:MAG: hypothetical protein Q4C68_08190, partial [Moraxella sp.]|nr:hypothetical protein [Moraxella sp.]
MKALQDFVAVKQATFVQKYTPLWQQFDELCALLDNNGKQTHTHTQPTVAWDKDDPKVRYQLLALYRQICQHYALACQRNYSPLLTEQLHERVMMGYRLIHHSKRRYGGRFLEFVLITFPNEVRHHYRLFWLAFALFYAPFFVMLVGCF